MGAAGAGAEPPVIGTSTALLILLIAGVVFLAKAVADLRREVDELRRSLPARPPAAPVARPGTATADCLPPHLEAAICAAVFVALEGTSARILGITAAPASANWSLEGRRDVFGSHRVR